MIILFDYCHRNRAGVSRAIKGRSTGVRQHKNFDSGFDLWHEFSMSYVRAARAAAYIRGPEFGNEM